MRVAKEIVGEIILSESPEGVIKKWRNIFQISQKDLAGQLKITSSVVSDYESGRRKSPGIRVIKKYVTALLDIDTQNGGNVIRGFARTSSAPPLSDAIIDIKEFSSGMSIEAFCKAVGGNLLTRTPTNHFIYGYTIIDSLKAITEFSTQELIKLYGMTTQRCLIFTKVTTGKTPLVAIKLTNLHPSLVVLHGLSTVDEVAKRIADAENIPLAVSTFEKVDDIVKALQGLE
ncbi:MAG: helix-turn-helix domain-containing protein [Candidatus Aenigmarchaeota archaeon]|nr:helix-turn-helix domain-containing protein [Candidatus Aenigmarchaeota archaeon]